MTTWAHPKSRPSSPSPQEFGDGLAAGQPEEAPRLAEAQQPVATLPVLMTWTHPRDRPSSPSLLECGDGQAAAQPEAAQRLAETRLPVAVRPHARQRAAVRRRRHPGVAELLSVRDVPWQVRGCWIAAGCRYSQWSLSRWQRRRPRGLAVWMALGRFREPSVSVLWRLRRSLRSGRWKHLSSLGSKRLRRGRMPQSSWGAKPIKWRCTHGHCW
mmetsp:Transcript_121983/g.304396  ORF Transcript_121983/g.304396 Transcript_121983/m.304396 type:complete len:213 (+) Transcript_121983:669-1307(+)